PVAFLPEDHALAIAIMSYNGGIDFGLLGDFDALGDIDVVADGIAASLAELLAVARGESPDEHQSPEDSASASAGPQSAMASSHNGAPAPFIPPDHGRAKHGPAADMRAKRQRGSRPQRRRSES